MFCFYIDKTSGSDGRTTNGLEHGENLVILIQVGVSRVEHILGDLPQPAAHEDHQYLNHEM